MNYFTRGEVALHHKPTDAWLVVNGRVVDVSHLIAEYGLDAEESKPLLMFAGKDVSHWFERVTEEFIHYTDINTGERVPFSLHGIPPHVLDAPDVQWWRDETLQVGKITKQPTLVKIVNALIDKNNIIECCHEDTFQKIKDRYASLGFRIQDDCYSWVSFTTGSELDPELTLEENGIPDESLDFERLCMPTDYHIPAILLFYKDISTPPLPLRLDPNLSLSFDIQ